MKSESSEKYVVAEPSENQDHNKKCAVIEFLKNQNNNKKCVVVEFSTDQNYNKKCAVVKSLKNQKMLLYIKFFKLKMFMKFVVNQHLKCCQ